MQSSKNKCLWRYLTVKKKNKFFYIINLAQWKNKRFSISQSFYNIREDTINNSLQSEPGRNFINYYRNFKLFSESKIRGLVFPSFKESLFEIFKWQSSDSYNELYTLFIMQDAFSSWNDELQVLFTHLEEIFDSPEEKVVTRVDELQNIIHQIEQVNKHSDVLNLYNRIHPKYLEKSNSKENLLLDFSGNKACAVASIDIRESTQLMLNAKSPRLFTEFIKELSSALLSLIKNEYGIYDKFTGDGVLCFFPDFYTGEDCIYHALRMAQKAHQLFNEIYNQHRSSFSVVRYDAGLGIGVDYGDTFITVINDDYTVIGSPVVYACRLGSAPSGKTYFNQGVFDLVKAKYSESIIAHEIKCEFKHQGTMLAYELDSIDIDRNIKNPDWS